MVVHNQSGVGSTHEGASKDTSGQSRDVNVKVPGMRKKSKEAFRTISEVADVLEVQQHVLRFWETKFTQLRPLKRGGGRRYYRPEDVALLKAIQHLLYSEGYTIKGVQKLLKTQGRKQFVESLMGAEQKLPEASNLASDAMSRSSSEVAPQPAAQAPAAVRSMSEGRAGLNDMQREALQAMLGELRALRDFVDR